MQYGWATAVYEHRHSWISRGGMVTIEKVDVNRFKSTSDAYFKPQPTPDYCLPIGIRNILEELADRHDAPNLAIPRREIEDITNYTPGFASSSEQVPAVLGAELEDIGYTVKQQQNTQLAELDEIIQRGTASYPLVELDPKYFDYIENWSPQSSRRGYSFPHVIVPFKINSDDLLYYDPFDQMMVQSGRVDESKVKISKNNFFDLWNEGPNPRWTMWVEQLEQQTLQAALQRG